MKRTNDRFDCKRELGQRLRECRVRANLTQQMLATAMGRRGKGGHHVAGRLERGEVPHPSLDLIADYLRACRAGFADLLCVLDPYTSRPTVVEVETVKAVAKVRESLPPEIDAAVLKYDLKTQSLAETGQGQPIPPAERVRRARNFGLSQVWARRVRRMVVSLVEVQQPYPGQMNEAYLQNYGRAVWRILNLTRKRQRDKRQAMLDEAVAPYAAEPGLDPELVAAVRQALFDYFGRAELAGELDARPAPEVGDEERGPRFQSKPDTRPAREAWDKARQELIGQLWQEMVKRPELSGVQPQRLLLWQSLVRQFASIVEHTAPGSDECRKQVEALATDEHFTRLGRDPALVRKLAEVVIPRWEELRSTLGPHPMGLVRPPR
jgi:hypothetical protein